MWKLGLLILQMHIQITQQVMISPLIESHEQSLTHEKDRNSVLYVQIELMECLRASSNSAALYTLEGHWQANSGMDEGTRIAAKQAIGSLYLPPDLPAILVEVKKVGCPQSDTVRILGSRREPTRAHHSESHSCVCCSYWGCLAM